MLGRRRLGRTGLEVSTIGFGGIPIMRVSREVAERAVRTAVELGINFIDTARGYGDSERKIGAAIRGLEPRPILASKSPKRDRQGILEDFDETLRNLEQDRIEIYQLHCVNKLEEYERAMGKDGAYRGLEDLKTEGRIDFIGITSHNLEIIKRAILSDMFDTVQILFNFLEPEAHDEIIPLAQKHDVGIIAMKPLAGGCIEDYKLGLKFVTSHDGVVAIPGMADEQEVRLNIEAVTDRKGLSEDELRMIEDLRSRIGRTYCRRCDYCQPCPNGIPISFALHIENIRKRIGDEMMRSDAYRDLLAKVEACVQCGKCEERCPFDLPVRDLIAQARSILSEVLSSRG